MTEADREIDDIIAGAIMQQMVGFNGDKWPLNAVHAIRSALRDHGYEIQRLPDSTKFRDMIIFVHPEVPPHAWDGEKMMKIEPSDWRPASLHYTGKEG